jgi:DsbC/DsbD-like thiol-disulfide interchange protein
MPPELDFSAATNLTLVKTSYPVPEATDDADGRFVGYHGPVRLLLDFAQPQADSPSRLTGKVVVGLCQDICLPFQAEFDLPLDPAGDDEAEEADIVLQAREALPEAPSADFKVTSSGLTADRSAYHIAITLPVEGHPTVFPVPSRGLRFSRPLSIRISSKSAEISIPIKKLPKSPEGASIDLLVKTGGRAMETTLALE